MCVFRRSPPLWRNDMGLKIERRVTKTPFQSQEKRFTQYLKSKGAILGPWDARLHVFLKKNPVEITALLSKKSLISTLFVECHAPLLGCNSLFHVGYTLARQTKKNGLVSSLQLNKKGVFGAEISAYLVWSRMALFVSRECRYFFCSFVKKKLG